MQFQQLQITPGKPLEREAGEDARGEGGDSEGVGGCVLCAGDAPGPDAELELVGAAAGDAEAGLVVEGEAGGEEGVGEELDGVGGRGGGEAVDVEDGGSCSCVDMGGDMMSGCDITLWQAI